MACAQPMAGFYHQNMRVQTPDGPVVVRVPIVAADRMDLVIWPEHGILRAIQAYVRHVPRLRNVSDEPAYQLVDWIDGNLLDDFAPDGFQAPEHVIRDLGQLFAQLGQVPLEQLPPLPSGWPADGATDAFAHQLSEITTGVHARFASEFGDLFDALGFPADPIEPVLERWSVLSPRPFRLLHTDLHRKNMIVDGRTTYFLDWELALWGDPVYDLAGHLHKMAYQPDEEEAARAAWLAAMPADATVEWRADLAIYLAHEQVKSAIVDSVRYAKLTAADAEPPDADAALIDKLTAKVRAAHAVWKTGRAPDRTTIEGCVRNR
ncbi:aminoglycoside phosphotransferase family protein [Frankia sp. AgB1.9]|uniref:phosphotransferase family protein n=2 Tax=Frankia TaxID=1854 RepID=UPI0019335B77|nr:MULTISPECIES: aminoglycoside phosphotransferase family protein [unclassified Frankia]MBL7547466.1 aminoglycoside phosphotransferase family protein [Frankia sp. AgB1.9]